jgi:hypothetical protein
MAAAWQFGKSRTIRGRQFESKIPQFYFESACQDSTEDMESQYFWHWSGSKNRKAVRNHQRTGKVAVYLAEQANQETDQTKCHLISQTEQTDCLRYKK